MKRITLILFIAVMMFATACNHKHVTSISITENENNYSLTASFDASKTARIQQYISKKIEVTNDDVGKSEAIIASVSGIETKLKLAVLEGSLSIDFNKKENSLASYEGMKDVFNGVKEILK